MKITDTKVLKGFIKLCTDGWDQGWHERNGGNCTYRMSEEDVASVKEFLNDGGEWIPLGNTIENLAGEYFIATGTGKYFRNVALEPEIALGICKINDKGDAYKIVWGLNNGKDRPTSEFPSHLLNHSEKKKVNPDYRTIYHCHPVNIIALTFILPNDNKVFSKALWCTMTECPIIFPHGVAVVPWMVPGSFDIAVETSKYMDKFDVVIWGHHGIFCASTDFENTFGLMHCVEKSAQIYLTILNSGKPVLQTITDENLLDIAKAYHVDINKEFLDL